MPSATNTVFTSEGKTIFDKIVDIWPPIIKAQRSREIDKMLSLLMSSRKVKRAGPALAKHI